LPDVPEDTIGEPHAVKKQAKEREERQAVPAT